MGIWWKKGKGRKKWFREREEPKKETNAEKRGFTIYEGKAKVFSWGDSLWHKPSGDGREKVDWSESGGERRRGERSIFGIISCFLFQVCSLSRYHQSPCYTIYFLNCGAQVRSFWNIYGFFFRARHIIVLYFQEYMPHGSSNSGLGHFTYAYPLTPFLNVY